MSFRLPFIRPVFPSADALSADFQEIVDANWYTNFGPKEREFSAAIERYVGEGFHAVTFANATIALVAALHVRLGRGDGTRFVIVPSFTFAAGALAIEWAGYRPLFIDIDLADLQPSFEALPEALSAYPGAVAGMLLCNTFGMGNARIAQWEDAARESGLPLIVDSAAGFGSRYSDSRRVGTAGDCEIFSFHATKPFAIGEGGAVVTTDADFAARLKEFTNFGFHAAQGAVSLGLNGKLQEINAAIGLRQLPVLDESVAARQRVVRQYRDALSESAYRIPEGLYSSSVCFATLVAATPELRDAVLQRLRDNGVEARTYYSPPIHLQPQFVDAQRVGTLSSTENLVSRVLSVPVYSDMTGEEIAIVVDTLNAEAATT